MQTTTAAVAARKTSEKPDESPSGTTTFRPFHLRTATLGVDLECAADVGFTSYLNRLGKRLSLMAQQLIEGAMRAEQSHRTPIRSLRIAISPIDRLLRRFAKTSGWSDVRDVALGLGLTLEAVAKSSEQAMRDAFGEALSNSSSLHRMYCQHPADKNFFIGGFGMDLRHGREPLCEAFMDALPLVLEKTEHLFAYASLGYGPTQFAWESVDLVARSVKAMGSDGAKFAAGINLRPNTPFFPASFHRGGPPVVTVGMSGAGFMTNKLANHDAPLDRSRIEGILAEVEKSTIRRSALVGLTVTAAIEGGFFGGVDPSQAPEFCDDNPGANSIGALLERIGGVEVGRPGTKDAFGTLMAGLKRGAAESGVPLVGFGGEFLPVAEDDRLAARASQKVLRIETLLDLTSICAGGLDMVVLNRQTREDQIARVIRDVVQSARFKEKPLAVRLIVPKATALVDARGYCVLGGLLGAGPEMDVES